MEELESHHHLHEQPNYKVTFQLPAVIADTPHREPLIQISPMPDNTLLALGQDGLLSVWTSDLKLKKSRFILDENKQQNRKIKWISDSTLMPHYNKIVVGTCDREIRLYELSNFEPYCQIVGFETIPLHLGYSQRDTEEGVIYFGDEQGCVNIILISRMAETLRNWTKCQAVEEIPSISIDNIADLSHVKLVRWKVHNDWVTQIRYVHSIESIISSSNDDYTSLIIGCVEGTKNLQKRLKDLMEFGNVKSKRPSLASHAPLKRNISDESLFRVKRGVKTFDFSKEANVLVTGGMDRIVRIWNPYVPGWPTGLLRGHSSPISYIQIADENTKIYSVSTDCAVMVWDIENHSCLLNCISKASQVRGELATCYFSHQLHALYLATDALALLQIQESATQNGSPSVSHNEPVTSCLYNHFHQQIISCTEASVMKTWDLLTGQLICEVQADDGWSAVTCLALDSGGNRLVTGSMNGSVKQWDYMSDSITFMKMLRLGSSEQPRVGISDVTYAEHSNYRYIISVSCDGRIRIFQDQHEASISAEDYPHCTWENHMTEGKFSLAASSWNLMATSNYAGEVCVWSLGSGDVFSHLKVPEGEELDNGTDDLIINKVLFMGSRVERGNEAAVLIASGPKGNITFWSIADGGKVFGRFAGSHYKSVVSDIAISEDDSILCAADEYFYVYIWDILEYALKGPEEKPPVLLHCWRAHLCAISRVIPVVKHKVIVTSSQDCTVKLWTMHGEYIGTFGQGKPWCIKHTEVKKESSNKNCIYKEQVSPAVFESRQEPEEQAQENNSPEGEVFSIPIDEKDIAKDLRKITHNSKNSRIKNVGSKQLELQQSWGRLSAYKSLQICDLMPVPATIRKPNLRAVLNDPYDLAF
ncbi:WD repeat-containing protein 49-like isoform X1 [Rana temporaria]|uniref:WD repeat-containing protein 49-like isoform X1 n=1 Tax=Rana temporaria TaxID=8407 RepID=UPI001AADA8F9|nr:WD repeat-containing protein 49-like isoform X1 [Rana temporaria]XP_040186626.1 WD repeat-containing protein 49-like isoform X1 [Rana temporaria]